MDWLRNWMMPPQGSAYAGEVDFVYMGIFWLCAVMFVGIAGAAAWFSWRYRFRPGRITPHDTHNTKLEVIWTVLPLILCIGIFFWGLNGWMKYAVAPGDAMEVQVTAKKWLWQFEYPDGTRTVNEIHVPANKAVKFVMTSEDVIHDFFVPDMRVKHDIIPGRYTEVWFTPTVLGKHRFTCAEYCGKGHSDMHGDLSVDNDADYAKFLETGGTEWEQYKDHMDQWGKIQYERNGCSTCHTVDGSKSKGPSWKGIWHKMEKLNNGTTVLVDEAYVRESMLYPQAKVVDGFEPIMPSFNNLLRDNQIKGLIAYIQSLQ
jgi:cytochrome c oxidase subunit 2